MVKKQKLSRKKDADIILKALEAELESESQFPTWVLLVTTKKLTAKHKTVIIDVYEDKKLNYQLTITTAIESSDEKWVKAQEDFREQLVFTFGSRGKGPIELVKEFFKRSITEGKVQDFF